MSMTNAEIHEWAKPIAEDFKVVGIPITVLKNQPKYMPKNDFFISVDRFKKQDTVRMWPGGEDVNVEIIDVDFDTKQLILKVTEVARERTDAYEYLLHGLAGQVVQDNDDKDLVRKMQDAANRGRLVPVTFPEGTTYDVTITSGRIVGYSSGVMYEGKVTSHIPSSTRSFLIGYDETNVFISELPSNPKTITGAHKALRPNVSKNAIRVGEWFFDPVTNKRIITALDGQLFPKHPWQKEGYAQIAWSPGEFSDNGPSRNHRVEVGTTLNTHDGAKEYGRGIVHDIEGRHSDTLLVGWHEIVRNLEVESDDGNGWD